MIHNMLKLEVYLFLLGVIMLIAKALGLINISWLWASVLFWFTPACFFITILIGRIILISLLTIDYLIDKIKLLTSKLKISS
jgi:hypothetical protein